MDLMLSKCKAKLRPCVLWLFIFALTAAVQMLSLPAGAEKSEENNTAELELLSRAASAAVGESDYAVQVSLCAILLNRKNGSGFPDTLAAVISDLLSEDTVLSLAFADAEPSERNIRAAAAALRGGDPTRGALYFARADDLPADVREGGRVSFEFGGYAFWK